MNQQVRRTHPGPLRFSPLVCIRCGVLRSMLPPQARGQMVRRTAPTPKCGHACLGKDEHFVAGRLELPEQAVHQAHLAALLDQVGRRREVDGAVKGRGDEVRVVAVFAHLHEHVVERGDRRPGLPGLASLRQGTLQSLGAWSGRVGCTRNRRRAGYGVQGRVRGPAPLSFELPQKSRQPRGRSIAVPLEPAGGREQASPESPFSGFSLFLRARSCRATGR